MNPESKGLRPAVAVLLLSFILVLALVSAGLPVRLVWAEATTSGATDSSGDGPLLTKVTAYTARPNETFAVIGLVKGSTTPAPEALVQWTKANPDGVVQVDFAAAFPDWHGELASAAVRHSRLVPIPPPSIVRERDTLTVMQPFADPTSGRDWTGVLQDTWAATEYRSLAELGLTLSYTYKDSITRWAFFALVLRGLGWAGEVLPPAGGHLTGAAARYLPDVDRAVIEVAVERGLIKGRAPGDLALDQPLTRAEAATFLLRMAGVTPDPALPSPFADVPADHWARAWVATAAAHGIVGGYGGGQFGPQDKLTWEQGVALVFRQAVRGRSYGNDLFGFYAIQAFDQRDAVPSFNKVAFGWARLAAGGTLDLSGQDFYWPSTATISGPDGLPREYGPAELLQSAKTAGVGRTLMVYSGDKDGVLSAFLADLASQAKFNTSLLDLVQKQGFDGVTLDFEGLGWGQEGPALAIVRARLSRYVSELHRLLGVKGLTLYLAVHPTNSAYPGYDYSALAANSDGLVIMAYEYTSDRQPQPIKLVEKAVREAAALAAPSKLYLGVNAYAETAESVKEKRDLAIAYNLKGVAVWRIGLLSEGFLDACRP